LDSPWSETSAKVPRLFNGCNIDLANSRLTSYRQARTKDETKDRSIRRHRRDSAGRVDSAGGNVLAVAKTGFVNASIQSLRLSLRIVTDLNSKYTPFLTHI
jgi:hypothetical protein